MKDAKSYDSVSGLVLFIMFFEGLVPFPAKFFGWKPLLALPVRLPDPAWWIVSSLVLVVGLVALLLIDRAKKARFPKA